MLSWKRRSSTEMSSMYHLFVIAAATLCSWRPLELRLRIGAGAPRPRHRGGWRVEQFAAPSGARGGNGHDHRGRSRRAHRRRLAYRAPDRAAIETFEVEGGPVSTRSLFIDGERGWTTKDGQSQVLPQAFVGNEQEQFYLCWLIRLVPLLEKGFRLTPVEPDADGRAGFRVRRDGRRDATCKLTADARLARIVTTVTDPTSRPRFAGGAALQRPDRGRWNQLAPPNSGPSE